MTCLDLTLPTPAENLACDEALAEQCEAGGPEWLRFWEPASPFVVLGYANRLGTEVNQDACRADGVPILRRVSGGGAVLQMPGCLNYALGLRLDEAGELATVAGANQFIMERNADAISRRLGQPVQVRGHTDLALRDRKFSGNSQRRFRHTLLFHGSVLLNADLSLLGRYLRFPSQTPDYRAGRSHAEFVTNLPLPAAAVKDVLRRAWQAHSESTAAPLDRIRALVAEKYARAEWNEKF
jgi:lipoate-protein ligase A